MPKQQFASEEGVSEPLHSSPDLHINPLLSEQVGSMTGSLQHSSAKLVHSNSERTLAIGQEFNLTQNFPASSHNADAVTPADFETDLDQPEYKMNAVSNMLLLSQHPESLSCISARYDFALLNSGEFAEEVASIPKEVS